MSFPNFVTMRRNIYLYHDETQDTRHGVLSFYKGFCSSEWFICTSLTDGDEHVATEADCSLSNRRASLSRSLATDVSVDS